MATPNTESKTTDESKTADSAGTEQATTATETSEAQQAAAAAYYQQYGYQYGYYPYNYAYSYNGYNGYDTNQDNNTAAYQQYYQQYQQQLLAAQQTDPNTTNHTQNTNTAPEDTKPNENTNDNTAANSTTHNSNEKDNDDQNTTADTAECTQPNKDLKDWTHLEVAAWVKTVNNGTFNEYTQSFVDNEIDGNVLYDMTPQQLQLGLYMNNMIQRLEFHKLIQTLKLVDTSAAAETAQETVVKPISELQRAPPMRKRKNKKKKKKNNDGKGNTNGACNSNNIATTATAAFLKLGTQHAMEHSKSSSQMLMEKMTLNNKRKLNEMDEGGMQHKVEWKYRENDKYNDLTIEAKDSVLFEWEYTRNVWRFVNKDAYDECDFDTNIAEEMCGSDCDRFVWMPKKVGLYYFGCQVANCARTGNMKIQINVVQNQGDENVTKKRRIE
eukprot:163847_1